LDQKATITSIPSTKVVSVRGDIVVPIASNRNILQNGSMFGSVERPSHHAWIEVPRSGEKDDIPNELTQCQVCHTSDEEETFLVHGAHGSESKEKRRKI
jgi:hypothetical protein